MAEKKKNGIPLPDPLPGENIMYAIPIVFPDRSINYAIPIGNPAALSPVPQPLPVPHSSQYWTPVVPLPSPLVGQKLMAIPIINPYADEPIPWSKVLNEYLDENQRKALAKMELDFRIELMDAHLQLVNSMAQKQIDLLKRASEMIR
jgi:hypothetical protein